VIDESAGVVSTRAVSSCEGLWLSDIAAFLVELSGVQQVSVDRAVGSCWLVGSFVIAGAAAGFAIHEAVLADADIELGLAQAAELIALALRLRHFALAATLFTAGSSGGHRNKVTRSCRVGERDGGNFGLLISDC
jgi:hypothetical protein